MYVVFDSISFGIVRSRVESVEPEPELNPEFQCL